MFYKPDDYYDVGGGWRREPGGGPILLNLTHEVNNLLSLVGDIVSVQAVTSNATRGFPVEDTAYHGVHLRQRSAGHLPAVGHRRLALKLGADVTGEHQLRHIPRRGLLPHRRDDRLVVDPDDASEDLPGKRSWWEPFDSSTEKLDRSDPLANQVEHFAAVIRGEAQPICSGRDGLKTLKVVDAVVESARTGRPVEITN